MKIIVILIILTSQWLLPGEVVFRDIIPGKIFLLDDQGYMYTDQGEHTINKYSPEGKFLLKIGQKGEGPGDIKRLGGFGINPADKNIYVTEFFGGNKWISKFSTEGKFLETWKSNLDWKKWKGLWHIKFSREGNAFIEMITFKEKKINDYLITFSDICLLKFSPDGKQECSIFDLKIESSISDNNTGIGIPFKEGYHMDIDSGMIFLTENETGFVSIFDHSGNLKKKIPVPFKQEKITGKDKDDWYKDMLESPWAKSGLEQGWLKLNTLQFYQKRMPFPAFKPVSDAMIIDGKGNLYIRKYSYFKKGEKKWAKINISNGNFVILKSKPGEELLAIRLNDVYIKRPDNEGDNLLVKTAVGNFFYDK